MSDEQTQLLAQAFHSVQTVLSKIHSEFKTMALIVVLLVVAEIAGATWFVVHTTGQAESRMIELQLQSSKMQLQMIDQLKSITEGMNINQNVWIDKPNSKEDVIERDMIRRQQSQQTRKKD